MLPKCCIDTENSFFFFKILQGFQEKGSICTTGMGKKTIICLGLEGVFVHAARSVQLQMKHVELTVKFRNLNTIQAVFLEAFQSK